MSSLDQAFIKAFSPARSPAEASPAGPHMRISQATMPLPETERKTRTIEMRAAAPPSTTRPLSAFSAGLRIPEAFRPQLEVDRFLWPAACRQVVERAAPQLGHFVEQLMAGAADQKIIAFAGNARQEGTTTTLLTVARTLAEMGTSCVLVDADFDHPQLAQMLGISADVGWDDVISGAIALADALVASIEDRTTLLPWRQPRDPAQRVSINLRGAVAFGMLRDHYDLVLVDAGPVGTDEQLADLASWAGVVRIDATYLVFDSRAQHCRMQGGANVRQIARGLSAAGVRVAGLIETFAHVAAAETAAPLRAVSH